MTNTSHGYHISGTVLEDEPAERAKCGGPTRCKTCMDEVFAQSLNVKIPTQRTAKVDYQELAKASVVRYFNGYSEKTDDFVLTEDDVYIVWFVKVLQNWKALLSTNIPDGMYYELTYNGDKSELYIDAYKKFNNVTMYGV